MKLRNISLWVIVFINLLLCVSFLSIKPFLLWDFSGQWKLCAYSFQGIDPYPLIGVEVPVIDSIGSIPKGWGTSPWGLFLGNFFYPGFLPYHYAEKYFLFFNLILITITSVAISNRLKTISGQLSKISLYCILFSFSFYFALLLAGNAGCSICCLLLLALFYYDINPIIAGVLLGISMIKPQTALIFCIAFAFLRQYRVVLIALIIVVLSWLLSSFLVHNTPLQLFREFLYCGVGNNENYSGIFTLLSMDNARLKMGLSMITGIIYVMILHLLLPINLFKPFKLFPACLASTFWCYSFCNEYHVLLLPLIVCLYLLINIKNKLIFLLSLIISLYFTIVPILLVVKNSLFIQLNNCFPYHSNLINRFIIIGLSFNISEWGWRTFFEFGIIVFGVLLCFLLNKVFQNNALITKASKQ